jgi:methionyl-tRNA formyltransferase
MRLAFLGSPPAAVPTLRALLDAGHDVALVVSGPDKRRGRGGARTPTPVKAAALEAGLPVTDRLEDVVDAGVELGVVVAYGRIIPASLLERVPMVNLHFSLLPRWRGAAPVERAILAGDDRTGVCVMDVAEGLDTGDVHAVAEVPIDDEITADALTDQLAELGARLLVDTLATGLDHGRPQSDEGVTYAHKITNEDRHLDWTQPAEQLRRVVRIGGAWTTFRGERLKVHAVAPAPAGERVPAPGVVQGAVVGCGDGRALQLVTVQPQGRAAMDAAAWANGARPDGERLGDGEEGGGG